MLTNDLSILSVMQSLRAMMDQNHRKLPWKFPRHKSIWSKTPKANAADHFKKKKK